MENQHKHQQNTSTRPAKKENSRKKLLQAGLTIGVTATAFAIIWLMEFTDVSSSRLSSSSEITAQEKSQSQWSIAQKEFEQKIEALTKKAEREADSIARATEQNHGRYFYGK